MMREEKEDEERYGRKWTMRLKKAFESEILVSQQLKEYNAFFFELHLIIFFSSFFPTTGLLTATVSSEVFKAAQPALLYLVPFTLLPLLTMAYLKVRTTRISIPVSITVRNV